MRVRQVASLVFLVLAFGVGYWFQREGLVDLDPRAGATGTPVFESNDAWYLPIAGLTGVSAPGPRLRIYRVR